MPEWKRAKMVAAIQRALWRSIDTKYCKVVGYVTNLVGGRSENRGEGEWWWQLIHRHHFLKVELK